jgi:hypothetical protein
VVYCGDAARISAGRGGLAMTAPKVFLSHTSTMARLPEQIEHA